VFPSYTPDVAGTILWEASFEDGNVAVDKATATTAVTSRSASMVFVAS